MSLPSNFVVKGVRRFLFLSIVTHSVDEKFCGRSASPPKSSLNL